MSPGLHHSSPAYTLMHISSRAPDGCLVLTTLRAQRVPRALWDTNYGGGSWSKHRRLTHLTVVEALQSHVAFEQGCRVLDCCGGNNDAIAVVLLHYVLSSTHWSCACRSAFASWAAMS